MKYIQIHPKDNVAVALSELSSGEEIIINGNQIVLSDNVPAGHKILLCDLSAGSSVIKYGYPIGHLRMDKHTGCLVDDRHIETDLSGLLSYTYQPLYSAEDISRGKDYALPFSTNGFPTQFQGYRRKNGDVGIRNELWVIPTVGCVNGVVNKIVSRLKHELSMFDDVRPSTGIERIVGFQHPYGCSQLGDDHEHTRMILRDMALHPNAGAVLIVGLGCENNQPHALMESLGNYDKERIRLMVCQEVDGDEVDYGVNICKELMATCASDHREACPIGALRVGLKCGGSDGFSGITGNPLLGMFSDYLVGLGGSSVLTEVPEMFGAETILMNRCTDKELFEQLVAFINDFKQYYLDHGEPVGENPSPGNKAGGISTLEEKALGCTQKSGRSAVRGILGYGDRIQTNGLNLLSAPGNDLVASTALAASGCHLVLFTTGRGTPFGTFVPTLKVSTNSGLPMRKPDWIDFNAGTLVEGEEMSSVCRRFVEKVISIASGEPTWNERKGYTEIAIFKNGVTL